MSLSEYHRRGRNCDSNLTRLVTILLWAALALVQIQHLSADGIPCETDSNECRVSNPADGCTCHQFLDKTTDECRNCRNCCDEGQVEISACSRDSDTQCSTCVPGIQFYNRATSTCQNCTVCAQDEQAISKCTVSADTQCQPRCQEHQYYAADLDECIFNCKLCKHDCITSSGSTRCRCQPSRCYDFNDLLCKNYLCEQESTTPLEATGTVDDKSNDLPAWGIGLISIGVVIGIVAFSAGTMILGFCTRKSPLIDVESESGIHSKTSLDGRYASNQPGALLCGHSVFDKGRMYGYSAGGGVWPGGGGSRAGSVRTNSIRSNSKTHSLPRLEKATPI